MIQQAIAEMNLAIEDFIWIHSECEQHINQSKGFKYKIISGEEYKKGLQIKVIAIEKGELLEAIA